MKRLFFSSVALMCFLLCLSCRDDDEKGGRSYDPSRKITLTDFTPEKGKILEQVLLRGDNFGNDPNIITVYFNRKKAKVVGAVGDEMFVIVPRTPGDTCTVWVVIGTDSSAYTGQFYYSKSTNVSTIAGTGDTNPKIVKNLSECTFNASGVYYDEERKDILLAIRRGGPEEQMGSIVKINEIDNTITEVVPTFGFLGGDGKGPQGVWINGKLYLVNGRWGNRMITIDPNDGYRVKEHPLAHKLDSLGLDQREWEDLRNMQWRGSLVFSTLDSCFYYTTSTTGATRGMLVKTPFKENLTQMRQEIVAVVPGGAGTRLAIHPVQKNLLFMVFQPDCQDIPGYFDDENGQFPGSKFAGGLAVTDIYDLQGSIKKLNYEAEGAGWRDGFMASAQFNPTEMFIDQEHDLYIVEKWNHRVRKVTLDMDSLEMSTVETAAGTGNGTDVDGEILEAGLRFPTGACRNNEGILFVTSEGRLRRVAFE